MIRSIGITISVILLIVILVLDYKTRQLENKIACLKYMREHLEEFIPEVREICKPLTLECINQYMEWKCLSYKEGRFND